MLILQLWMICTSSRRRSIPNQLSLKGTLKICMTVDIFKEALKGQAIRLFHNSVQQGVLFQAEDMRDPRKLHGSVIQTKMITNTTILKSWARIRTLLFVRVPTEVIWMISTEILELVLHRTTFWIIHLTETLQEILQAQASKAIITWQQAKILVRSCKNIIWILRLISLSDLGSRLSTNIPLRVLLTDMMRIK